MEALLTTYRYQIRSQQEAIKLKGEKHQYVEDGKSKVGGKLSTKSNLNDIFPQGEAAKGMVSVLCL